MHDDAYDGADPAAQPFSGLARAKSILSTVVGAIVAMSMLMALGIWFYRLGVRDAQNVPIIRAAAEPSKERPEDPGGLEAPHQNIQSYEVASDRPASVTAVVVAPEPPSPKPEDVPLGEITPAPAEVVPPVEAPAARATEQTVAETAPASASPTAEQTEDEATLALNEVATATAPATEPEPEPAEVEPTPAVLSGTEFAPPQSPVAPRRPADLAQRTAAAANDDARRQDDLASAAASSRVQIQLAADPSQSAMRQKWDRVRKANSDILRGRALALPTTVSGGTTYYRLRVGPFKDAAEARNVCQALKARGQDCIVARNG